MSAHSIQPNQQKVWFVGAGPGDPDLITVKGRDLIAKLMPFCSQAR